MSALQQAGRYCDLGLAVVLDRESAEEVKIEMHDKAVSMSEAIMGKFSDDGFNRNKAIAINYAANVWGNNPRRFVSLWKLLKLKTPTNKKEFKKYKL